MEQMDRTRSLREEDIDYWGLCIFGPKEKAFRQLRYLSPPEREDRQPGSSPTNTPLVDAFALVIPGRHRAELLELAETAFDAAALFVTAGSKPGGRPLLRPRLRRAACWSFLTGMTGWVRRRQCGRWLLVAPKDNGSTRCCHVGYGIPGFPSAGFGIPLHADRPVFRALPNQTVAWPGMKVSRVCVHLSPSVARCPGRRGGCAACRVTRCGSGANRYELADSITDSALAGLFRAAWAPARSARLTRMAAIVTNKAMSMIPADTSNPRENPTDNAWS